MQPDIKREQRNGWLVLGAAGMLSLICVGWYSYDDPLAARLESAKVEYNKLHGKELMSTHIRMQQQANQVLSQTIEELKQDTGAPAAEYFTITDNDLKIWHHESSIFTAKYDAVRDECNDQARNFGLRNWGEHSNLGFPESEQLPSDADAPYLLTMLQLTRRAARICFSSPPGESADPIKDLEFSHDSYQHVPTGPAGRPPLLTEFPLTVKITATLPQTMWILWRFSVGRLDELQQPSKIADRIEDSRHDDDGDTAHPWDDGAYPFVLQSFKIISPVTEQLKENEEPDFYLTVTFRLAGMRFVSAATRSVAAPVGGKASPPVAGAAGPATPTHTELSLPMGHPAPRY